MRGACLPRQEGAFSEGSENPFDIGVHEDFLKAETRRAAKAEAEARSPQGGRQAPTQVSGRCEEGEARRWSEQMTNTVLSLYEAPIRGDHRSVGAVSHHISELTNAGLIEVTRDGLYRILVASSVSDLAISHQSRIVPDEKRV
jgi:DNA-binding transcriptional ArsR family regulator